MNGMQPIQPIACSLGPDERVQRIGELRALARQALKACEREGDRAIVLTYRAEDGIEEALRELIRREAQCCPFFDFELVASAGELTLRVAAPAEAAPVLDAFYESSANLVAN